MNITEKRKKYSVVNLFTKHPRENANETWWKHFKFTTFSDEIRESLDAQGAQEDSDVLNESLEEVQRPIIDFSKWHDDGLVNDNSNKTDGNKFRTFELLPKDQLLAQTKKLVPEQRVVLFAT